MKILRKHAFGDSAWFVTLVCLCGLAAIASGCKKPADRGEEEARPETDLQEAEAPKPNAPSKDLANPNGQLAQAVAAFNRGCALLMQGDGPRRKAAESFEEAVR